jgi:hypothetical protein
MTQQREPAHKRLRASFLPDVYLPDEVKDAVDRAAAGEITDWLCGEYLVVADDRRYVTVYRHVAEVYL